MTTYYDKSVYDLRRTLLEIADGLVETSCDSQTRLWEIANRTQCLFEPITFRYGLYLRPLDGDRFRIAMAMLLDDGLAFQITKQTKSLIECVKMCKAALILKGDF